MNTSMSLKYEPSSEPLHISVLVRARRALVSNHFSSSEVRLRAKSHQPQTRTPKIQSEARSRGRRTDNYLTEMCSDSEAGSY